LFEVLTFRPAEVDFARAGDGGDEGWLEFVAETTHFRKREFERGGHVLAGHVARGEDKLAYGVFFESVFFESVFFEEVVADAFVRGQQDPALRTYEGQPSLIENSSIEVSEVPLEVDAKLSQCVEDRTGVGQIFVEVEDEVVRRRRGGGWRAPSGWLLRFAAACSHILQPSW